LTGTRCQDTTVWYPTVMIDFPIADLFDDSLCLLWLSGTCIRMGWSARIAGVPTVGSFGTKTVWMPIAAGHAMATTRC